MPELRQNARVLMIRMSALGDVLFALEALASLKAERPDVIVDFLVEDRFQDLLQGHRQIADVLVYPRKTRSRIPGHLIGLWRRGRYDAVIDLHGNAKSSLQLLFCRAKVKLGFDRPVAKERAWHFYSHKVKAPTPLPHRADRGLLLLKEFGLSGDRHPPVVPTTETPWIWGDGEPRIILHPGTSAYASFKRWPVERYAELARRLEQRGMRIAVSAGPGEHDLAQAILGAIEHGAEIPFEFGLRGLAHVIEQSHLMVAADTGPLHIAAGLGKPVVALFGPKDPSFYYPRVAEHVVLYHDVPCRPCLRRRCPTAQCVRGVDVDAVETAVLELLGITA